MKYTDYLKSKGRKTRKKRKPRIPTSVPRMYKTYIKSQFWEDRKNKYWRDYGRKCGICSSTHYVTLHHKIYISKEFGFEPDDHVVAFCVACHFKFHNDRKTKRDMIKETNAFVKEQRLLYPIVL